MRLEGILVGHLCCHKCVCFDQFSASSVVTSLFGCFLFFFVFDSFVVTNVCVSFEKFASVSVTSLLRENVSVDGLGFGPPRPLYT